MSDVTQPGTWQPDPFGRYAQRYWDGARWTEHVTDGAGNRMTDPPVPMGPPGDGPARTATTAGGAVPVPGLVVVAVGALAVVLSDFVLDWFSPAGASLNLSDVRDLASASADVPFLADQYLTWGWIVALVVVAFAVAALFVPVLRLPAIVAAVVVAAWHAWTVYDTSTSEISPEIGAWLGAVGFVLCAVALVLPRPAARM